MRARLPARRRRIQRQYLIRCRRKDCFWSWYGKESNSASIYPHLQAHGESLLFVLSVGSVVRYIGPLDVRTVAVAPPSIRPSFFFRCIPSPFCYTLLSVCRILPRLRKEEKTQNRPFPFTKPIFSCVLCVLLWCFFCRKKLL